MRPAHSWLVDLQGTTLTLLAVVSAVTGQGTSHEPYMSVPASLHRRAYWQRNGGVSRRRGPPSKVPGTYGAAVYGRMQEEAAILLRLQQLSPERRRAWAELVRAPAPATDYLDVQQHGVRAGAVAAGVVLAFAPVWDAVSAAVGHGALPRASTAVEIAGLIHGQWGGRVPRSVAEGSSRQTPCAALQAAMDALGVGLTCLQVHTRGAATAAANVGSGGVAVVNSPSLDVVSLDATGEFALAASIQRAAAARLRAAMRRLNGNVRVVEATLPRFVIVAPRTSNPDVVVDVQVDDFLVRAHHGRDEAS